MKGNTIFIGGLVSILLVGIVGFIYKEKYFSSQAPKEEIVSSFSEVKSDNSSTIKAITKDRIHQKATIQGNITSRINHKDGHVFLKVEDHTGSIKIVIFKDKKIQKESLIEGENVRVSGTVEEYNGELELIVDNSTDLTLTNNPNNKISDEQVGSELDVVGKIVSKYTHPEGHIFLNVRLENNQEITVPLFNNMKFASDDYSVFSTIRVIGTLDKYNDTLQIKPDNNQSITVLEKGNESKIQEVEIEHISEQDQGKMIIVEGFVKNIEDRNDGHLMFDLESNGNGIKTVLFKADSNEIKGRKDRIIHAEKAQFPVRVVAMVDIYKGELEIIVDKVLVD
ncbi:exodeoxyribonuclease VII large subunit [Rossellomorea marisflavi]|uniref:exodeoxyribonuclease VII large subunit n=1 Tax=Rossellomorea marisflavi TaxID=189381 RepID=UPI0027AAFA80|nr:exodeoxyribonuclease VII large subunit [Rossellomorea marisflavi]UTE74413.1 exodeoxyribonuclease VII large subunit [Rossellomorea marisflavi]